jgi:uncharacterized protein (TIGR03437 family)
LSFGAILLKQSDGYLRVSAAAQTVVSVNAASYQAGPLARGSLASVFGNNLATESGTSQDVPPPTKLSNVTLELIASDKVKHDAGLVMVSGNQINYVIPDNVAEGPAQIVIKDGDVIVAKGELKIVDSNPALFTSGSSDKKLAVGMIKTNGMDPESIVNSDGSARMLGAGAPWAPNTLTLLATGLRYAENVRIRIGDQTEIEPTSVRPGRTPGVDEVTLMLPMNMRNGMNKLSLVASTRSSAAATSGATNQAADASQSSSTTVTSNDVQFNAQGPAPAGPFAINASDVQLIIAQAVAKAQQLGVAATIAVLDTEGNVLGIFKMNGARSDVLLGSINLLNGSPTAQLVNGAPDPDGLEQVRLPLVGGLGLLSDGAALAAISKAGTAAFFSTQGSSISTRTASFIVQENFPPTVTSQMGGPLFGVQFSQLPCSDVRNPTARNLGNLPLGLSGDPGGLGIYKNGVAVGGVGIEFNGFYAVDKNPQDFEPASPVSINGEEIIAAAAIKGYRPIKDLQADNLLIDGMRLAFSDAPQADGPPAAPYATLVGTAGTELFTPRGQLTSGFSPLTLGGVPGRVTRGFFPFMGSQVSNLTAADTTRIITQAAQQAYRLRAAIRRPIPSQTEVNICVLDIAGNVLGLFSTQDAPQFGYDVACQKGRTAVFFSLTNADALLRQASMNTNVPPLNINLAKYADASTAFGVPLNGKFAFTSRAMGFLARPFFPDGINGAPNGPFSKPINIWSPFNDGIQIALVKPALVSILTGGMVTDCSPLPNFPLFANGFQIFAGSSALFKNGQLVGAVGISGDGIDQDDIIGAAGAFGFEAPAAVRADQLMPKGVRLPYVKFPRHPNIGTNPANPPIIRTSRVFSTN